MSAHPIVVSFHSSDDYYREAAALLRSDCHHLGIDNDIVELAAHDQTSWIDICRRKVRFYLEMHHKHRRPLLWLDVDSRLPARLDLLDGANCDMAGFLRGFRYLRDFDPLAMPRFFAPFALYFNVTPRATAFLELMAEIERRHADAATDDYFLQEAWRQHQEQLSVLVLPPDLVGRQWPLMPGQKIYVGISGNVSKFKQEAEQHVADILTPARRKAVLLSEAAAARREGDLAASLVLYKRALALAPDAELAAKLDRLAHMEQRSRKSGNDPKETPG